MTAIGVDETSFLRATGGHPTRYATGIADLTPGRPARLLDVVAGRSGAVLAGWLRERATRGGADRDRIAGPVPRLRDRVDISNCRKRFACSTRSMSRSSG